MRMKSDLYKTQQKDLRQQLVQLLDLDKTNSFLLSDLDANTELQTEIVSLSPQIRQYFSCNNIKAISEPSRIKRPWLSIIKTLLKPWYNIVTEDYHFTQEAPVRKYVHTQKYTFHKNLSPTSVVLNLEENLAENT
jgi:hypothetical protein